MTDDQWKELEPFARRLAELRAAENSQNPYMRWSPPTPESELAAIRRKLELQDAQQQFDSARQRILGKPKN